MTHVNGVQDKIYYGLKNITKSGFAGSLDVDANVSHNTNTPVENIYIDNIASGSKIKVVVNFFSKGSQSPLETPFTFIATINNAIEAFVESELHTVKGEVTVWEKIYEAPLVFVDTIEKCPPVPPQHEKSYGRLVDKVSASLTKGRTMKFMKIYPSFATILSPRNVSSDGSVLITENYPILIELPDALEGVAPSVTIMPVFGDLESKATVVLDEVLVMDNPDRRANILLCVENMVDYCKYLSLVSAAFNPDSKEAKQLKALMSTIEKYIVDFKVDEERKEDKDESVSQIGMKMKERFALLKAFIRKGQKMNLNESLQLLNASNVAKLNSAQKSELLQSRGMIPNTRAGRGLAKRVGVDFDLDQCMIDCLNAVSKESDRVCPGRSIFSLEDCNDTIAGATTLKGEILNASGSSAVVDSSVLQTALLSNLGIPGYSLKLLRTEHNFVFPEPFQFQDIMPNILEVYPTVCNTNDPILAAAYRNDGHPDSVLRCPGQGDSEILGCVPTLGTAGDFIFSKGGSQLVNIITSYQLRGVVAPVPKDYEAFLVGAIRSILSKGEEALKFSWCKDMLKDLVDTLMQKMEYSKASYEEITNTFEALFPQDSFTADNAPNKYLASLILYGQKHLGKRGVVLSVLVRSLYQYSLWCNIRHYFNNVAKPSEEGKESTRNDLFDLVLRKIDRNSTFPIPGPYATSAIPVSEIKCLKVDDKLLEAACTEIIEPLGILPSSDFFGNLNSYLLHDIHKIPASTSVLETEEVSPGCWNDKKWVMSAVLQTLKFPTAADRFRTEEQSIIAAGGLKSKVIDPTTPAEVDGVIVDVISKHFVQKLQEACRSHATNLIAERKQECIDDLVDDENMTEFIKGLLKGDMKVGMSDYELLLKYCDPPIATELFGISVKFKREKCLEVVRERFDACDEELRSRFKIREKIWFLLFGCTFDFYNTTGELYDAAVDLHPYQGDDFRSIVDATLITFPKIEEAYAHLEATRKWVYRACDTPNRHGFCNSNPSEWALCYGNPKESRESRKSRKSREVSK